MSEYCQRTEYFKLLKDFVDAAETARGDYHRARALTAVDVMVKACQQLEANRIKDRDKVA